MGAMQLTFQLMPAERELVARYGGTPAESGRAPSCR